jgi:hypothetical protein
MANFTSDGKDLFIDGRKVLVGFETFSGWYFFGVEKIEERKVAEGGGSMIDGKEVDDTIWYGFVQGLEEEWGDFSEAEVMSLAPKTWPIKACDLPSSGRRGSR